MLALRLKTQLSSGGYIKKPLALLFLGLLGVALIYSIQNYLKYSDHADYKFLRSLGFNVVSILGFFFVLPLTNLIHDYLSGYSKKAILLFHFSFSLAIIVIYSLVISAVNYSLGFNSKPFHEVFLNKYFLNMALFHWIFYWVFAYTLFPKSEVVKGNKYLTVSLRGNKVFCPQSSVVRIEAMDHYVKIFTKEECYLKKISLKMLEKELRSSNFVRIHRSHIINKAFVKRVESKNGTSMVVLKNDTTVGIGKTYLSNNDLTSLYFTND